MLDVYLTRFQVRGRTRRTLLDDVVGWASDRLEVDCDALREDGEAKSGDGPTGRWMVEGPPDAPEALDVSVRRRLGGGLVSVTRVEVVTGRRPSLRAAVSVLSEKRVMSRPQALLPPEVVVEVVARGDAIDGPVHLSAEPQVVTPPQVEEELFPLLDSGRMLPVVCFSLVDDPPENWDPGRYVRRFVGMAHVVFLTHEAAWTVTQLKDKRWSTYRGAVRVYRAGLTWADSPIVHPLWITKSHPHPEAIPDAVRQTCVDDARLHGFDQWWIPQRRLARFRDRRDSALAETSDDSGWVDLLEEVEAERDELAREVEALRREVARLSGGSTDRPPPRSVGEALARVAELEVPGLVILDSAWESAADASFRRPERALEVLEAVAELARAYHQGSLTTDFRSFLAERGVKLGYVTAQTRSRWPDHYRREYRGRVVELSDHAKVGTRSPQDHFRVYWYRDSERRELVVGHVGDHLPNRMS
jgi:hypothetical protein